MLSKLTSGRFLFTIITAVVFAYGSFKQYIPTEKQIEIIMLIIVFYFSRTDRNGNTPKTP